MQGLSAVQSCNAIQACNTIQACSGITVIPAAEEEVVPFTNTYSVDFDGTDDYATIADSDDLTFGDSSTDSPFSISAWIKNDSIGNTQRIVTKDTGGGVYEYLFTINGAGYLALYLYDNGSVNNIYASTNVSLLTGVWYHVVATYDGSGSNTGITLYVDGATGTISRGAGGSYVAMHNTSGNVSIGRLPSGSQFFSGKIDEVAVIPSELSAAQVAAIYNSGEPADLTSYSPTAWTRFEEGSGTSIADSSGNGHTATLTNGPTFSTDVPT